VIPRVTNLFPALPGVSEHPGVETIHTLIQTSSLRLEQIVSRGQASEPGFWYDQSEDEWVLLLRGTATLDFSEDGMLELKAGGSLTIPAHQKHRVEKVSQDAVWVALHHRTEG
jgi:cupin 2 domain-containing protein